MSPEDARKAWQALDDKISDSDPGGCRSWSGGHSGGVPGNRYPTVYIDGVMHYVHRLLFELTVGDIPEDYVIKPMCSNRGCVEATHMRAITKSQKSKITPGGVGRTNRSKTHCPKGHPYTWTDGKSRRCAPCRQEASTKGSRKYRAKLKSA